MKLINSPLAMNSHSLLGRVFIDSGMAKLNMAGWPVRLLTCCNNPVVFSSAIQDGYDSCCSNVAGGTTRCCVGFVTVGHGGDDL